MLLSAISTTDQQMETKDSVIRQANGEQNFKKHYFYQGSINQTKILSFHNNHKICDYWCIMI